MQFGAVFLAVAAFVAGFVYVRGLMARRAEAKVDEQIELDEETIKLATKVNRHSRQYGAKRRKRAKNAVSKFTQR